MTLEPSSPPTPTLAVVGHTSAPTGNMTTARFDPDTETGHRGDVNNLAGRQLDRHSDPFNARASGVTALSRRRRRPRGVLIIMAMLKIVGERVAATRSFYAQKLMKVAAQLAASRSVGEPTNCQYVSWTRSAVLPPSLTKLEAQLNASRILAVSRLPTDLQAPSFASTLISLGA